MNTCEGLDISDLYLWNWVKSSLGMDVDVERLSCILKQIGIKKNHYISSVGAEFRLFPSLFTPPDVSILFDISHHPDCLQRETDFDGMIVEIRNKNLATSIWLELDYPYSSVPLIYFTLTSQASTSIEYSLLTEVYSHLKCICSKYYANSSRCFEWPTERNVSAWLKKLPAGEVQQLGFSFRKKCVQVRCLLKPSDDDGLRTSLSPSILKCLTCVEAHAQNMYAFAYPFLPQQMVGYEVLVDPLAKHNLRNMRQPPRVRGTRWLASLVTIIKENHIESTWGSSILKILSSLERRQTNPVCKSGSEIFECLDLSGWNHYKISFRYGDLESIKLYGGTVRNRIHSVSR
jgi:hypothetical protein